MHKIKEMLMNELYEYEEKAKRMTGGKISASELDKIHKLTDTVKNICKIDMLEEEEGGYSEDTDFMGEGRMYGTSYARGGRGRGRNAKRDSMGRYSSENRMYYDDDNMSYARDGRNSNRGGMRGGYSRDDAKEMLVEKAEHLLKSGELDPKQERAVNNLINALDD
jgi:hypothetical protein